MSGYVYPNRKTDGTYEWIPSNKTPIFNPPPVQSGTIFGYNSADTEAEQKFTWFGKLPIGRMYYGFNAVPSNGQGFIKTFGKEFKAAALHRSDVVSSKRLNVNVRIDPGTITSATSPRVVEIFNYCRSIPAGWHIYLSDHEYNLFIENGVYDVADYQRAIPIVAAEIYRANLLNIADGLGAVTPVVNAAGYGVLNGDTASAAIPAYSVMPPGTQLWWDAYNSFSNKPQGFAQYKKYGAPYGDPAAFLPDLYQIVVDKGYAIPQAGWGIGEFNSPRRVAPKLPVLDTRLGWGPASPYDISGEGQAKSIDDYTQWCLAQDIPPKVMMLWAVSSGVNANQSLATGGRFTDDDYDISSPLPLDQATLIPGPHFQGFPITVSPDLPLAVWQGYLDQSL